MDIKRTLKVSEIAQALNKSEPAVRKWLKKGCPHTASWLGASKRVYFLDLDEVKDWIKKKSPQG